VNSSHVAMLDFKIEQITGKKIKENQINNHTFAKGLKGRM
jgi:hypothetical protein